MKLINKISAWLKELKLKLIKIRIKYLPVAVNVVQVVKKAINNGTLDTIEDILKFVLNDVGDKVVDVVVGYLKKHIPELCVELEILNATTNTNDIESALKALKSTYGDKWEQFMSGLAGDLLNMLSDGKITIPEARVLAKKFYDEYIK